MNKEKIIELLTKINTKLGFIIGNKLNQSETNVNDKVAKLAKFNFDYNEISEILGITTSHAAKELSKIKGAKKDDKEAKIR
ncbi:MAG: hypothetical protein IH852_10695 [Bacteroidetes bacterium]|nr:hypothetical protein [Bacteroidota bacterium]